MTKKSRNLRKNLMNPTRKKRIFNILIVLLFSISGISMILYSLNTNLDYFFTPSELNEKELSSSKRIKIGGMVLSGSVKRDGSEISFVITDYFIGFHNLTFFTWGSVFIIALVSKYFVQTIYKRILGSLVGALIFFIVYNFDFYRIYNSHCSWSDFI